MTSRNRSALRTRQASRARRVERPARSQPPPVRLARVAKGKRPQYFADPAVDKLLAMTLTLMEELSVTRDRLDTLERLLARKRVVSAKEISAWKADSRAAAERAKRRSDYVDRVMRAVHAELEEVTSRRTLRDPTDGASAEAVAAVEN